MPIWNCAPASWRCTIIELVFAKFKEQYRRVYENEQDKQLRANDKKPRGWRLNLIYLCIEKAWAMVTRKTVKKVFIVQLAKAGHLIKGEKM